VSNGHFRRASIAATGALSLVLLSTFVTAASGARTTSKFVTLDPAHCVTISSDEASEQATRRCKPSVDGWTVYEVYADQVSDIALEKGGVKTALVLYRFDDGGYSSLGPAVEFRVRNQKAISSVVRLIITNREILSKKTSKLMVTKLGVNPCLVAVIKQGKQQSAQARAAADQAQTLPCL
jgi:hypothetical protein